MYGLDPYKLIGRGNVNFFFQDEVQRYGNLPVEIRLQVIIVSTEFVFALTSGCN